MSIDAAREVADAVLYEGYLLYPYRASAAKNRSRWQFGVLGPPLADVAAFAEPAGMSMDCLLTADTSDPAVTLHLRFLQLQERVVHDASGREVAALTVAGETVLSWDEAVAREITLPRVALSDAAEFSVAVPGGTDVEPLGHVATGSHPQRVATESRHQDGSNHQDGTAESHFQGVVTGSHHQDGTAESRYQGVVTGSHHQDGTAGYQDEGPEGRILRRRWPLAARVRTAITADGDLLRLTVAVTNEHPAPVTAKAEAVRFSLLGTHVLVEAHGARFVSVQDPPPTAAAAAARCRSDRCWPVLAPTVAQAPGAQGVGGSSDADTVLLGAPIILYDHPAVAAESPAPLFDLTEIDEILTLRVMTMTDAEKAEARATDPRARTIVDHCDALSAAELQRLHGGRRDPPAAPNPPAAPAEPAALSAPGPPLELAAPAAAQTPAAPAAPEENRWDSATATSVEVDVPWWDPAEDRVDPATATVLVGGVPVGRGSLVRVHPSRRADAQDLFFADRVARVSAVISDVDGETHVALTLVDDPAADLHDWYGRYLYFAPDELEPLDGRTDGC